MTKLEAINDTILRSKASYRDGKLIAALEGFRTAARAASEGASEGDADAGSSGYHRELRVAKAWIGRIAAELTASGFKPPAAA